MKDIAFVFLPFGVILSILLLSGVTMFQRVAISFQKKSIRFQIYSKHINVSASSIILFYTIIRFIFTIIELNRYKKSNINFDNLNAISINRNDLKKMRLQRNFWILLLCSITWFFLIRFSYLLIYYREKVKEIDEQYEKELSEKKKRESAQKEKKKENENYIKKASDKDKDKKTEKDKDKAEDMKTVRKETENEKYLKEDLTKEDLTKENLTKEDLIKDLTEIKRKTETIEKTSLLVDDDTKKTTLRQRL